MTVVQLHALAHEFFEWPDGSDGRMVTLASALLFAKHVLKLREQSLGTIEKSLGIENNAGMDALRDAAQQALEALDSDSPDIQLRAAIALRAALEQAESVQDQDVEDAIEAAYWHFDARKKGLNEWASAPQSERDAFKAEARKLAKGYFPTRQALDTKREMLAVADAFIRGKRAALEQEQKGGGNLPPPLQVPPEVAGTLTTSDIAWLETRRLTKLWQELGQMRWDGSNESWNHAIKAVRSRINDECQAVLDWKAMADQSNVTAMELLQKMQGVSDE